MSENVNQLESMMDPYYQEGVDGTLEALSLMADKRFGFIDLNDEITELPLVKKSNETYEQVPNKVILIKPINFEQRDSVAGYEVSIISVRPIDKSAAVTQLANNYETRAEGTFLKGQGERDQAEAFMQKGSVHTIHNALADYLEAKMQ